MKTIQIQFTDFGGTYDYATDDNNVQAGWLAKIKGKTHPVVIKNVLPLTDKTTVAVDYVIPPPKHSQASAQAKLDTINKVKKGLASMEKKALENAAKVLAAKELACDVEYMKEKRYLDTLVNNEINL